MKAAILPVAVNYHLNKNCNFRCKGCYATFNDDPAARGMMLPKEAMFRIVEEVAAAPLPEGRTARKLTFAGGEPTLCRWLPELIAHAKSAGLVTMLVTNGSLCSPEYLRSLSGSLDWLTLSIDSIIPATNLMIGRHDAKGLPLTKSGYALILGESASLGIRTKINTVVTRHNLREDLSDFLTASGIERWKVLQVMPVEGQNDTHFDTLSVSEDEFEAYLARHRMVGESGIRVVPEPVSAIRGSYCMIDPQGRFFDSSRGAHTYGPPILSAGIEKAFAGVCFDERKFSERGGDYDFAAAERFLTSPDVRPRAVPVSAS